MQVKKKKTKHQKQQVEEDDFSSLCQGLLKQYKSVTVLPALECHVYRISVCIIPNLSASYPNVNKKGATANIDIQNTRWGSAIARSPNLKLNEHPKCGFNASETLL